MWIVRREVGGAPRQARKVRSWLGRRASRHGRRRHDAGRPDAGAGRSAPDRTGADRRAAAPSPSPGIVYPTLTYLEEAGYVTAQVEGAKKLYTITEEGRAHLDENRDFVDAVLERLAAMGERVARMRRRFGADDEEDERRGTSVPRLVRAALENLREVAAKRLEDDADAEAKVVEVLARAASEVKKA